MLTVQELSRMSVLLNKYKDDNELLELTTLVHTYNSSRTNNSLLAFKELLIESKEVKQIENNKKNSIRNFIDKVKGD